MKKSEHLRLFYVYFFARNIFFSIPIIYIFFEERGLNAFQIFWLQTIFQVAVSLLEVPTGAIADSFGEKMSIVVGCICWICGLVIYAFCQNFIQLVVAECTLAAGLSLMSGAQQTLLKKTLRHHGQAARFPTQYGICLAWGTIGATLGMALGSTLADLISLPATFLLTAACSVAALVSSALMKQPESISGVERLPYLAVLRTSFNHVKDRPRDRLLLLYSATLAAITNVFFWAHQPYMRDVSGLDPKYFGFVYASLNMFCSFLYRYGPPLTSRVGFKGSLAGMLPFCVLPLLLAGLFPSSWSFGYLYLHQVVRALERPVVENDILARTPEEIGSTVLSLKSLMQRFVFFCIAPTLGWAIDHYSVATVFTYSGIISSVVLLLIFICYTKTK